MIDLENHDGDSLAKELVKNGFVLVRNWESLLGFVPEWDKNGEYNQYFSNKSSFEAEKQRFIEFEQLRKGRSKIAEKSGELRELCDLLISMTSKSFGFEYSFFEHDLSDQTLSIENIKENTLLPTWNAFTLVFTEAETITLRSSNEPVDLGPGFKMLFCAGKMMEMVSGGLIFNNIAKVPSPALLVLRSFNLSLQIKRTSDKYGPLFGEKKNVFRNEFLERTWNINYSRNPSIGPYKPKVLFNKSGQNVHTGEEHLFGYIANNGDYFEVNKPENSILRFVSMDLETDPYLVSFSLTQQFGHVLYSALFPETRDFDKFRAFRSKQLGDKMGFLERVFSNLDNIIYIYFLSHTNWPVLNTQFLPALTKLLGDHVTVSDILRIKHIYPGSYNLYRTEDAERLVITLPEGRLKVSNFAKEIADRKNEFSEKMALFRLLEGLDMLDQDIAKLYHSLPSMPASPHKNKIQTQNKVTKLKKTFTKEKPKDMSLLLLERIKLKEQTRKQGNTLLAGKSANLGELTMIFEILYNLNSSDVAKSFPMDTLVVRVSDSLKATKYNLMSQEHIIRVLRVLDEKLPDEIFLFVKFGGLGEFVKFNFYNQRAFVLEQLKS